MKSLAWYGALLAIALVAIFAQLDRQARYAPALASLVPDNFSSFAAYHKASADIVSGDADAAGQQAMALVARRPMPAENLRLLAQALALAENEAEAGTAIQQAARRGWRDPVTQRTMLEMALAAGDYPEATRRLAAIWARSPDRATLQPVANRVLSNDQARAEMARLLRSKPRWSASFERIAPEILETEIVADIEQRWEGSSKGNGSES